MAHHNSGVIWMKYRCCNCNSEFRAKEAVDGYQDGYKVGFLCPNCRANITSDGKSDIMTWETRKGRRLFTAALALLVLGQAFWRREFEAITGVPWVVVGSLALIASAIVIYALNKNDPETKIWHTKYVDKTMNKPTKPKKHWES